MKKPPSAPKPSKRTGLGFDPLARSLANAVRAAHGVDQAATFDMSEELGAPRGFVGTCNIAVDRALGSEGGVPMGRITEISGWPGAGKSTMLDQILAETQRAGGIAVLADTERTRNRAYMNALGVQDQSLVWIGGKSAEAMFEEVETLARHAASLNAAAWRDALLREKIKCPKLPTYVHETVDPDTGSVVNKMVMARWGREQAAALLEWQRGKGLPAFGIRDSRTRNALRPCTVHAEGDEAKEAIKGWVEDGEHPLVMPADRPITIGWDSVAGTATEAEMAGSSRDQHPAAAAKVIRKNFRRLIQLIDDERIAFVLVNQRYEKIAMGGRRTWGPQSETYGGGGIKYHTTVRIEVDKIGNLFETASAKADGDPPIGQIVRVRIPKNKVDSPLRSEEFALVYGRGAENAWTIHDDLKKRGVIKVGGGWSGFTDPTILGKGDRKFRGWMELSNMMAESPELWEKLRRIYMAGGR